MDINDLNYEFVCTGCGILKPNSEYNRKRSPRSKRLFNSQCKQCVSDYGKRYKEKYGEEHIKTIKTNYYINNKEELSRKKKVYRANNPFKAMINSSRMRGFEADITEQDLVDQYNLQEGLCFYTRDEFINETYHPSRMSIDRIDSSKGYMKGNVVLCKYKVNIMKNNATLEELFDFCEKILKNRDKINRG